MKIIVFGATGRTGTPVIKQALEERNHEVTAFVRSKAKLSLQHTRLNVVEGDVLNREEVIAAIEGHDAVISVLGQGKNSPKNLQEEAMKNIVAGMNTFGVKRLVSLTGAGVKVEKDVKQGAVSRLAETLLKLISPDVLKDGENHVEVIRKSGLTWTVVRGPRLTEGKRVGNYQVGYFTFKKPMISRQDLAEFILDELEQEAFVHEFPTIGF